MPELGRPDTQRGYRMAGKIREIALGTNDHPADDPDLQMAQQLGHLDHDGENWSVTDQGTQLVNKIDPEQS